MNGTNDICGETRSLCESSAACSDHRLRMHNGDADAAAAVRRKLESIGQFHGRLNHLKFELRGGALIVTGKLPSFYLKQLLQSRLQELDEIDLIVNRVAVVNGTGLSTVSGDPQI